jgi:hypothetical protein
MLLSAPFKPESVDTRSGTKKRLFLGRFLTDYASFLPLCPLFELCHAFRGSIAGLRSSNSATSTKRLGTF